MRRVARLPPTAALRERHCEEGIPSATFHHSGTMLRALGSATVRSGRLPSGSPATALWQQRCATSGGAATQPPVPGLSAAELQHQADVTAEEGEEWALRDAALGDGDLEPPLPPSEEAEASPGSSEAFRQDMEAVEARLAAAEAAMAADREEEAREHDELMHPEGKRHPYRDVALDPALRQSAVAGAETLPDVML
ncbi:phosphatidylinositol 3-and 4-kinase [Micractinium conductrix]|uniref:Phosphatidylinositol 3-and 4-kinase n=1 Tax=Micractinium conductrix TaxID=554055 RepID=A0A2P6V5S4_9CHLO|nr:phosphatidylinositol 3-and 4-kinase [Micractinium conductrix]|eukprot:PSC69442.1 phosphatidylinositol 3-and 4-kinase [Micractinium conductrix]